MKGHRELQKRSTIPGQEYPTGEEKATGAITWSWTCMDGITGPAAFGGATSGVNRKQEMSMNGVIFVRIWLLSGCIMIAVQERKRDEELDPSERERERKRREAQKKTESRGTPISLFPGTVDLMGFDILDIIFLLSPSGSSHFPRFRRVMYYLDNGSDFYLLNSASRFLALPSNSRLARFLTFLTSTECQMMRIEWTGKLWSDPLSIVPDPRNSSSQHGGRGRGGRKITKGGKVGMVIRRVARRRSMVAGEERGANPPALQLLYEEASPRVGSHWLPCHPVISRYQPRNCPETSTGLSDDAQLLRGFLELLDRRLPISCVAISSD